MEAFVKDRLRERRNMVDTAAEREAMVRLVTGRLLARLEGIRRAYVENPERASSEFRRIANEHFLGESVRLATSDPEFVALFETELHESLMPRYIRSAVEMNQREESGFGFGVAALTAGRLVTTAVALLIVWLFRLRLFFVPSLWPILIVTLSFPFWPDVAAAVYRAHYRRSLEEMVDDLVRLLLGSTEPSEPSEPSEPTHRL